MLKQCLLGVRTAGLFYKTLTLKQMNQKDALKNLIDFTEVLEDYKTPYWLEAGTCLGAVREGNFIGHDLDIDIGINEEHFDFRLLNKMFEAGFGVRHIFGSRACGMEIAFARYGVKIDLFLHYKLGNKRWNAVWANGGRNGLKDIIPMVFPADLFDEQVLSNLGGNLFKVPKQYERYVELWYGKTWRLPDKNWRWDSSSPAIDKSFIKKIKMVYE